MDSGPDRVGRWSAFEKWTLGLAVAFVAFAIAGGNTSDQWNGAIEALGSIGLMAWLFSIPIALVIMSVRIWGYWRTRRKSP
jgi:hypothetical protein